MKVKLRLVDSLPDPGRPPLTPARVAAERGPRQRFLEAWFRDVKSKFPSCHRAEQGRLGPAVTARGAGPIAEHSTSVRDLVGGWTGRRPAGSSSARPGRAGARGRPGSRSPDRCRRAGDITRREPSSAPLPVFWLVAAASYAPWFVTRRSYPAARSASFTMRNLVIAIWKR